MPIFQATSAEGDQKLFLMESQAALEAMIQEHHVTMGVKLPMRYLEIAGSRQEQLDFVMQQMPEYWRTRWCGGGMCGCMGAANCSGQVAALGFSHDEWQIWLQAQEKAEDPK
jgi:hypothetical protein